MRRGRASLIVIKDGKVLLIHRFKSEEEYWVLPGGGIEGDETGEEAGKRELKEETGLDVTSIKLACEDTESWDKNKNFIYLCQIAQGVGDVTNPEADKNTETNMYEPQWVEIEKVGDLTLYPESARKFILEYKQRFL